MAAFYQIAYVPQLIRSCSLKSFTHHLQLRLEIDGLSRQVQTTTIQWTYAYYQNKIFYENDIILAITSLMHGRLNEHHVITRTNTTESPNTIGFFRMAQNDC